MATWQYREGVPSSGAVKTATDTNGYVLTASESGSIAAPHIEVTLLSSAGAVSFKKVLAGPAYASLVGVTAANGKYFVVLAERDTYDGFWVVSISSAGAILSQKYYSNGGSYQQEITAVRSEQYTADVFVAGVMDRYSSGAAIFVTRINSTTGAVTWAKRLPITGATASTDGRVGDIFVTDAGVYLAAVDSGSNGILAKLNVGSGAVEEYKRFTWSGMPADMANSVHELTIAHDRYDPTYCVVGYYGTIATLFDDESSEVYRYTAGSELVITKDTGTGYICAEKISATEIRVRRTAAYINGAASVEDKLVGTFDSIWCLSNVTCMTNSRNVIVSLNDGGGSSPNFAGLSRLISIPYTGGSAGTYSVADTIELADAANTTPTYLGAATLTAITATAGAVSYTVTTSALSVADSVNPGTLTNYVAVAGGPLAVTLKKLTGALTLVGPNLMAATLPRLTGALVCTTSGTSGDMLITLPKLTGTLTAVGTIGGSVDQLLPAVTGAITGSKQTNGVVGGALPRTTAALEGIVGGASTLDATLPLVSSTIAGGSQSSDMRLPTVTAALEGVAGLAGTINTALTGMSGTLEGVLTVGGTMTPVLPRAVAALEVIQGNIATISATLTRMTDSATGVIGSAGQLSAQFHTPVSSFQGSAAIRATLAATLPRIDVASFTSLHFYEHVLTHVMNTLTAAVTLFQNYEYNSFAKFGDRYLAAGPAGLFIIDQSDKDNGVNIDAAMKSGELDFGSPQQKRMSDFYLAMRTEGDIALKVSTDELGEFDYTLKPYDIATLKQRRDLIGKGMRGRYWQFALSNTDGCDFDFDAYSMLVVDTSRRV